MPLSPQQHRRPALNPSLANADQNLTEVDTRLTGVDKGCQKLTPSTPAPTPNPSKTQQNRNHPTISTPPVSTFTVNPPGRSRTTLNKSEQT